MKKNSFFKSSLRTRRIAVCSLLVALGIVFMLIGAITEILDLTMLVLASLCIIFAVIEIGFRWAWLVWGVTALLCLLLLPSKTAALLYLLGGFYPIAKAGFEKYHPVIVWTLKLSLFNTLQLLFILTAQKVLGLSGAGYTFAILEILLGNAFFVLYDFALSACITMYLVRFRRRLKIKSLRE